jgi:hypothetical protein
MTAVLIAESKLPTRKRGAHPFFSAAGRNKTMLSVPPAAANGARKTTDVTITLPTQQRSLNHLKTDEKKVAGFFHLSFGDSALSPAADNAALADAPFPFSRTPHARGFDIPDHVTVATHTLPIRAAHKP